MDFEDPVPFAAVGVQGSHTVGIFGVDIQRDLVACNLLVWKYADQVSPDGSAIFLARFSCQELCVLVELSTGDF